MGEVNAVKVKAVNIGKQGTPYRTPSVKDLLRSRKIMLKKLQRQSILVRAGGRAIDFLKEKRPLNVTVEKLHLDIAMMAEVAEAEHVYAIECSNNLAAAQERIRQMRVKYEIGKPVQDVVSPADNRYAEKVT